MKRICIHTLNIGNYFPELTKLTLPTIERFAKQIKADVNIISERKFEGSILTEKLQVYEDGKDYEYNIFLDLDVLVHPQTYNPFIKNIPFNYVSFKDNYHAHKQLKSNIYFERDGRDVGISACAVFTTKYTHDLWKPLDMFTTEQINDNILQERKIVDEYTLSVNLSRYSYKYIEPYPVNEYNLLFHLGTFNQDEQKMLESAKLWYKVFWK